MRISIKRLLPILLIAAPAAIYAEDKGHFPTFGIEPGQTTPSSLPASPIDSRSGTASAVIKWGALHAAEPEPSSIPFSAFNDETNAPIKFQIVDLPVNSDSAEYVVSWDFDSLHGESIRRRLAPRAVYPAHLRYVADAHHDSIRFTITSIDGTMAGSAEIPISPSSDANPERDSDGVLMIRMRPTSLADAERPH